MSVQGPNQSRSPSRKLRESFSEQISDIKTRLSRALSSERGHDGSGQYTTQLEETKTAERSLSRGRDPVQSFGRGGFGNMRPSSTSRGPEDRESLERGRGANRISTSDGVESVPEDHSLLHSANHSTGRGGYANITEIHSPDIEPPVHVTHPEHERVSTGRGGVGNIRDRSKSKVRDQPDPHARHPHLEAEVFSSGRGGAGNIRSRSQSKPPKDEKAHDTHKSGVEGILHKVVHPHA